MYIVHIVFCKIMIIILSAVIIIVIKQNRLNFNLSLNIILLHRSYFNSEKPIPVFIS